MTKSLIAILLSLYTANAFCGYGGYIGQYDNRTYGSLSSPEYRGVTKLSVGGYSCTGGFVSKNLILTNDHCALHCRNECSALFWNGSGYEKSKLRVVAYYEQFETLDGNDWALLLSDKESNFYKPVSPTSSPGQIIRGGFGALRIIENDEIPFLKQLYIQTQKEFGTSCKRQQKISYYECINEHVNTRLENMGKKPLLSDSNNFKVQTCKILGTHPQSNRMLLTDCDSSGGDSGAPLLRNNQIIGLNNSGKQNIFGTETANASAIKPENFYKYVQKYIKKYEQTQNNTSNNNNNNSSNNSTTSGTNNTQPIPQPNQNTGTQNTNNPTPTTPQPVIHDDPQKIQQLLQQKLLNFDCD